VVFGGMTDFASFALTDSVISAELGPDGEIGVWETLQPLPAPRAWHGLALVDKAVFVIGGLVTTDDGSLHQPIRLVFGKRGIVQRCQLHKMRNVIGHLPKALQYERERSVRE